MANKYQKKGYRDNDREGYKASFIRMLPVLLMVGIVPLIVRVMSHETELTDKAWFGIEEVAYEFFLAPKSLVLMLLVFAMAIIVGMRIWKEKKKLAFAKILIPLLVYGGFVILSTCFSVRHSFSFSGGYEQFETVWALLSYVIVVYYVFLFAQTETELQVVADAICFCATVVGLLGMLQGLGFDFMATKFVQKLVTTESFLQQVGGELSLNFGDKQAYATLYNPNYLGVFGSFVLPFLTMLVLFEKNKWRRIWHGADFILLAIALLSSRSRAGLIAVIAALCVALVICARKILKWWYLAIPAVNFAVALVLLVNAYNDNLLFDRLQNIFKKDDVTVEETTAEDGTIVRHTGLTQLFTTEDGVAIEYNDQLLMITLYVEGNSYGIYAVDVNGDQVALNADENGSVFLFEHPALEGVQVRPVNIEDTLGIGITVGGKEWYFSYDDAKGRYQYYTDFGKPSDMIMAESFGFKEYQHFFSGRGYIWSRTLPLLKDHIFLGSGPDTFLLEFPQEDYLMMYKNGFANQVMTKPHSWYLQVGVQTGVLSLLCLLAFYGWYAVWSLRLYAFRKLGTQLEAFGIAAFIGSIGYMISGISNDSMVVTAPVFWGMIALGLTANVLVAKHRKQEIPVTEQKK